MLDPSLLYCIIIELGATELVIRFIYVNARHLPLQIPNVLAWHPSGTMFVAASRKGELEVFDMALSPLLFQLVAENPSPRPTLELASYFRWARLYYVMHS